MHHQPSLIELIVGSWRWPARVEVERSPRASARLMSLIPYRGTVVHARWSGEACWAPLASVWPVGDFLDAESQTNSPAPGEILMFAGPTSEPELYIPYGSNRFACRAGRLAGNRVLRILENVDLLREMGRQLLSSGAQPIEIRPIERLGFSKGEQG